MKVFVTGVSGQLGHDVMFELIHRDHTAWGTARITTDVVSFIPVFRTMDLTNNVALKAEIMSLKPDAIIHCAAWTAVDAAEDPENYDAVYRANVLATRYIAEAAKACGARMLYLSTDYVFDGQGERPWQPDDKNFAPLNVYGKSKLDGELAVVETLENVSVKQGTRINFYGSSNLRERFPEAVYRYQLYFSY